MLALKGKSLEGRALDKEIHKAVLNNKIFEMVDLVIQTYRIGNEMHVYNQLLDKYTAYLQQDSNIYLAKFNTIKNFILDIQKQYKEKQDENPTE